MEDNLYNSAFPRQKLPLAKKGKKWQEDCVNYIIGEGNVTTGGNNKQYYGELLTYYNLYNSIFDEKDFKSITNPFKVEDGFPATPHDFNIIRPKVDLLIGEETKRPLNFRVIRTSQQATSEMQEKEKQMLLQYVEATITARMSPEEQLQYQQQLQSGEIMPPESILRYMDKEYKDIVENTAYHTLMYLREKLGIDNEFIKGWKDGLIAGREIYYVGVLNAEPYIERVNPLYFSYDNSPDLEFIEDGSWCCRKMRMPITEVYDRYYDKLNEKDLDKLEEFIGATPGRNLGDRSPVDTGIQLKLYDNPMFEGAGKTLVNVWHCCWKSFKKIFYVTTTDETGLPKIDIVDETYVPVGTELSVEPDWIVEVWEGYRAGTDLYFGIQPVEYQHVSIDNPNSQKLPYCGAIYSNTNSKPRSLVSILKPLQYMYIVLWYRLELAIARDKGKVICMDITQIPKSMGITPAKWMHYLSSVGVSFVNPYECFKFGTEVIMADGTIRNIENVKVGESVMGPDGKPRKVLERHTGIDNLYRLKGGSGCDDLIVNSRHLIKYKEKNFYKNTYFDKLCTPLDLLKEDSEKPYIKTLRYLQRSEQVNIDWGGDNNLLDPYMLGLWLGNGFTNKAAIINEDLEVLHYIYDWAKDHNMSITPEYTNGNNAVVYNIVDKKHHKNMFKDVLRYYGILNNKFIPTAYIYTSIENRLQLLAGLIDTDGSFSKRDRVYTFSQCAKRKHIVDTFAFIARSLGFKCTVRHYNTRCKKHINGNKNISVCQDTYTVRIIDGKYDIPCKIVRKLHHWEKKRTERMLSHFSVEYDGIGQYCGLTVSEDHLFLLRDFTIVHNCGWNIPDREGGKPASFNQFQSLDLSMSNVIAEYIQLMDKIELLAGTISGITEQREGAISSSESVGGVERSVTQSSHITEPLFWVHNQCKRKALTMLLNTAKGAWEETGKTKLQYIFDNGERAFLDITPKFYFEDMDVFVSDTSKDIENIQKLQQLIQPAMQNGASLLEAAEVLTNDNFNIIKQKLKDMQTRQEQAQQQQQQAEAEQAQQLQQMQNESKQQELMLQEAQMDLQRYQIDQDNQTKIAVAQISAYRGTENTDQDMNGTPDIMEIGKQALERQKISQEAYNKRYETKLKREIEEQKVQLEREKMQHETELQKQKDDAAYERELLKAKTAIKNKVVGEK